MENKAQQIADIMNNFSDQLLKVDPTCTHFTSIIYTEDKTGRYFSGGNANEALKLFISRRMQKEVEIMIEQEVQSVKIDYTNPRRSK